MHHFVEKIITLDVINIFKKIKREIRAWEWYFEKKNIEIPYEWKVCLSFENENQVFSKYVKRYNFQ